MKIIPAIDLMNGNVVRLLKGNPKNKKIYSHSPSDIIKKWIDAGADMIQFVDLDATLGIGSNLDLIKKLTIDITIPFSVAGGLRTENIIYNVLQFSPYIILGTISFSNQKLLQKLLPYKNNIIISIDSKFDNIVIDGWKKNTGIKLFDGINYFIKLGFYKFLLTNVEKDGTLLGTDLSVYKQVHNIKNIQIFAAGGISSLSDIINLNEMNIYGIILGKAIYENLITIEDAKKLCH